MSDNARAALLAALTLIGFACALLLFAMLARCAAGDEAPILTPEVPEGRSPYMGPAVRLSTPEAVVVPLRQAPGTALLVALALRSAWPQS